MPQIPGAQKVSVKGPGRGKVQRSIYLYDFATDGGGTGTISLRGEALPSGAIVHDALIIVETIPTSGGGATISLGIEAAADVQAAAAISGSPWSAQAKKRGSALTAVTAPVVTTAVRTPSIVVGTAALTAGRFKVVFEWFEYDSTEV